MQEAQVLSLVKEVRPHMSHGGPEKKKKKWNADLPSPWSTQEINSLNYSKKPRKPGHYL